MSNTTRINSYKFSMSEDGEWTLEGDRESSTRQRTCNDDLNSLPYRRAARWSFPNLDSNTEIGPILQDSANEEMEDYESEEDDCVELVDIVDSIEVINISLDKEDEEVPSEGSSSVNAGCSD
ncbi:unnamed protein product [Lupinus luteus]|uniref:Uncharacterized protein n=1 Tax=Lupinus luteus TaxID=3873 RepID=A0AAV1XTR8_LUPLU